MVENPFISDLRKKAECEERRKLQADTDGEGNGED